MLKLNEAGDSRITHGEIFTRRWVVDVVLDLVGYTTDRDLTAMQLVEPSCGAGAFLVPIVERLIASWKGEPPSNIDRLESAITAFDLLERNVRHSRSKIKRLLVKTGLSVDVAQHLAEVWVNVGDYLLQDTEASLFGGGSPLLNVDFVVGNPPYIRLEDMPDELTTAYRSRWPTMLGRADIYIGFYERALRSLTPGGRLGFICADRWMRNQYGSALRSLVGKDFSVDAVWTMHDVDAFESSVSAYPAITILSRNDQGKAIVADTDAQFGEMAARRLAHWTVASDSESSTGNGYRAYRLPHWFSGDEMWPAGSPEQLALIEYLNDNFAPLQDSTLGTRVGIGVATGADGVYLTSDPAVVERDRLLPMAMVSDVRSGIFHWGGTYLINPWEEDGTLVDLIKYPKLSAYMNRHRAQLSGRHTAKRTPHIWHKTIDKVNHTLTDRSKLLIQDMRTSINPVLDRGGHYPHHNLYYVVSDRWDMEVLGGLLLSRVAQAFIEAYCVRMRGNTLRFQSQYLRTIRVPHPDSIPAEVRERLRNAFIDRDVESATAAARDAYKIDFEIEL